MSTTYGAVDVLLIIALLAILCAPIAALDQRLYAQIAYCAVLIPSVVFLFLWTISIFLHGAIAVYDSVFAATEHIMPALKDFSSKTSLLGFFLNPLTILLTVVTIAYIYATASKFLIERPPDSTPEVEMEDAPVDILDGIDQTLDVEMDTSTSSSDDLETFRHIEGEKPEKASNSFELTQDVKSAANAVVRESESKPETKPEQEPSQTPPPSALVPPAQQAALTFMTQLLQAHTSVLTKHLRTYDFFEDWHGKPYDANSSRSRQHNIHQNKEQIIPRPKAYARPLLNLRKVQSKVVAPGDEGRSRAAKTTAAEEIKTSTEAVSHAGSEILATTAAQAVVQKHEEGATESTTSNSAPIPVIPRGRNTVQTSTPVDPVELSMLPGLRLTERSTAAPKARKIARLKAPKSHQASPPVAMPRMRSPAPSEEALSPSDAAMARSDSLCDDMAMPLTEAPSRTSVPNTTSVLNSVAPDRAPGSSSAPGFDFMASLVIAPRLPPSTKESPCVRRCKGDRSLFRPWKTSPSMLKSPLSQVMNAYPDEVPESDPSSRKHSASAREAERDEESLAPKADDAEDEEMPSANDPEFEAEPESLVPEADGTEEMPSFSAPGPEPDARSSAPQTNATDGIESTEGLPASAREIDPGTTSSVPQTDDMVDDMVWSPHQEDSHDDAEMLDGAPDGLTDTGSYTDPAAVELRLQAPTGNDVSMADSPAQSAEYDPASPAIVSFVANPFGIHGQVIPSVEETMHDAPPAAPEINPAAMPHDSSSGEVLGQGAAGEDVSMGGEMIPETLDAGTAPSAYIGPDIAAILAQLGANQPLEATRSAAPTANTFSPPFGADLMNSLKLPSVVRAPPPPVAPPTVPCTTCDGPLWDKNPMLATMTDVRRGRCGTCVKKEKDEARAARAKAKKTSTEATQGTPSRRVASPLTAKSPVLNPRVAATDAQTPPIGDEQAAGPEAVLSSTSSLLPGLSPRLNAYNAQTLPEAYDPATPPTLAASELLPNGKPKAKPRSRRPHNQ